MIKYYQDNTSKKFFNYDNPLNSNGHFVLFIGSIADENNQKVEAVSLGKGECCLIGTGLRLVHGDASLVPIFTHSHHVALHLDRYFFHGETNELMLQVANPSNGKLRLDIGDEIASFVLVRNELVGNLQLVNSMQDLFE